MFVKNVYGNYINSNYIIKLSIGDPVGNIRSYYVDAQLRIGTSIMFKGTKEQCVEYMDGLAEKLNTMTGRSN